MAVVVFAEGFPYAQEGWATEYADDSKGVEIAQEYTAMGADGGSEE